MIVISIANKKKRQKGLYVGRPTIFGNYAQGDTSSLARRDALCDAYDVLFYERLESDPHFAHAVEEVVQLALSQGGLTLQCWCYPLRCHAQTLQRFIVTQLQAQGYDAVARD